MTSRHKLLVKRRDGGKLTRLSGCTSTDGDKIKNPKEFLLEHPDSYYALQCSHLTCLMPTCWVEDHVLDSYLALLRGRDREMRANGIEKFAEFFFMSYFFYAIGTQPLL